MKAMLIIQFTAWILAASLLGTSPALASENEDLLHAVKIGDVKAAEYAVAQGANVNALDPEGYPPLVWAISKGHLAMVTLLIEHGANPNVAFADGWNPLAAAFASPSSAQRQIILYLIDHGADLNAQGHGGVTALMGAISAVAARADAIAFVDRMLTTKKYDPDLQDSNGKTALMCASENGYLDFVTALLADSADVHLADKEGRTALMYAAKSYQGNRFTLTDPTDATLHILVDHVAVATQLLAHGADVTVEDKQGMTAVDYANQATVFAPSEEARMSMQRLLQGAALQAQQ
jgi:ankyrin repeat protein